MTLTKGPNAFKKPEYLRRFTAVKEEMGRRDIETLFVSSASNITYLTGYTATSSYIPQGLVISINKEEPTFITRAMDVPAGVHQMWIEQNNVVGYDELFIGRSDKDGYDPIIDFIIEHNLANHGLGIELLSLLPGAFLEERFKKKISSVRIVDCTNLVDWIRMIKSDLEISVMREAASITNAAIMRAAEVIRPDVREADAAAEIIGTLIRGANGKPGTSIGGFLLCASPRIGTPHIEWTEDVFRVGSQINIELSASRYGYVAPTMRTYVIGKPSDRLRRVHDAELAGMEAALKAAKVGATCGDVATAFYRTAESMGVEKKSRCGYPVGINWTEPTASLQSDNKTILKQNMTFHLMLGNWIDMEFGYVISETFRVTESGGEALTFSPRKIFELS